MNKLKIAHSIVFMSLFSIPTFASTIYGWSVRCSDQRLDVSATQADDDIRLTVRLNRKRIFDQLGSVNTYQATAPSLTFTSGTARLYVNRGPNGTGAGRLELNGSYNNDLNCSVKSISQEP